MRTQSDEIQDVVLVGQLDLYEDPETGSDLVAVYPEDGEEYVITNRKMAKKLMKYTEDDIKIEFTGTVREDHYSFIKVLTVESYRLLEDFHELKSVGTIEDFISDKNLIVPDEEPLDPALLEEDADFNGEDFDDQDAENDADYPAEDNGIDSVADGTSADEREMNNVAAEDEFEKMMDVDLRKSRRNDDDEEDDCPAEDDNEDDGLSPETRAKLQAEFENEMLKETTAEDTSILPDIAALTQLPTKPAKAAKTAKATKAAKTEKVAVVPEPPVTARKSKAKKTAEASPVVEEDKAEKDVVAPKKEKTPKTAKAPKVEKTAETPTAEKVAEVSKTTKATKVAKAAKSEKTAAAPKATKADKPAEAPKATKADKPAEAPKATKADKPAAEPKATKADKPPEAPKVTKADKPAEEPKAAKAGKAAEAPKVSKVPKATKADKPNKTAAPKPTSQRKAKKPEIHAKSESIRGR